MSPGYPPLEELDSLSEATFRTYHLGRRAVVLRNALAGVPAVTRWDADYLRRVVGHQSVKVKETSHLGGSPSRRMTLTRFLDQLQEPGPERDAPRSYLHDTPLLVEGTALLSDLHNLPLGLLPRWYRASWWRFALFFIGAPGSLTPLHFDSLETHNLFFQIRGRKRFIVVPPEAADRCYKRGWRWSNVDAERPDLRRYPRFAECGAKESTVGAGDMIYIPPRSFHQVRGLDPTISFNLDWHTTASAWRGVAAVFRGMPPAHVATNVVHALGLTTHLPARMLYPILRRHLEEID